MKIINQDELSQFLINDASFVTVGELLFTEPSIKENPFPLSRGLYFSDTKLPGLIEYCVSLRTGWLTKEGKKLIV
jgi:hypothetical protein